MNQYDHFAKHQITLNTPAKPIFSRRQVKIWNRLKSIYLQHFLFWLVVLAIVYYALSLLTFNILDYLEKVPHDIYADQLKHIGTYTFAELGWVVFQNAAIYCIIISAPVYLVYWLLYKIRFQDIILGKYLDKVYLNGWQLYIFLIFLCLLTPFLTYPTQYVLSEVLLSDITGLSDYKIRILYAIEFLPLFLVLLLLILCTSAISFSKNLVEEKRLSGRKKRQAQSQHLQKIIWQLRPHFVFNTLANIQALAENQSSEVPHLIVKFANLYRFVLDEGDREWVLLEKAMDFLKGYLDIAKLGLQKEINYQLIIIGEEFISNKFVTPLALQVIAENCFKHFKKDKNGKGFIKIQLDITEERIELITANSYFPKTKAIKEASANLNIKKSLGLKAVKEQLDFIYKENYDLLIREDLQNYTYHLKLKLPLKNIKS